jgi:hypothetical protein
MKAKKVIILAAATMMLTGCLAGGKWYKTGASQAGFDQDKAECRYAATVYGYVPPSGGFYRNVGSAAATGITNGIAQGMREAEVFKACMEAKGYAFRYDPAKTQ